MFFFKKKTLGCLPSFVEGIYIYCDKIERKIIFSQINAVLTWIVVLLSWIECLLVLGLGWVLRCLEVNKSI
jgi:hypothetical protein